MAPAERDWALEGHADGDAKCGVGELVRFGYLSIVS
jgi:hypothetical protein